MLRKLFSPRDSVPEVKSSVVELTARHRPVLEYGTHQQREEAYNAIRALIEWELGVQDANGNWMNVVPWQEVELLGIIVGSNGDQTRCFAVLPLQKFLLLPKEYKPQSAMPDNSETEAPVKVEWLALGNKFPTELSHRHQNVGLSREILISKHVKIFGRTYIRPFTYDGQHVKTNISITLCVIDTPEAAAKLNPLVTWESPKAFIPVPNIRQRTGFSASSEPSLDHGSNTYSRGRHRVAVFRHQQL